MMLQNLVQRGQIVKICGLRDAEHARVAAEAGADLVGFIFAPARRQVSAEVARSCIDAAKAANADVLAVGVFVDASPEEIRTVVKSAGLDAVQLNDTRPRAPEVSLGAPTIQALRPRPGASASSIVAQIDERVSATTPPPAFLIDTFVAAVAGGAGVRGDWQLARSVCTCRPVMLAGGLDPANVREAIRLVAPAGVDVSSGVEIDGAKNAELIVSFIREAKDAFGAVR